MANLLVHQRCLHHPAREAVSRCPGCRGFFCRECVTDHDGRLLCARCLRTPVGTREDGSAWAAKARWAAGAVAGACFAWAVFYYAGALLASLPSQFHEAVK